MQINILLSLSVLLKGFVFNNRFAQPNKPIIK
jgi:hypothetical protein